MTELLWNAGRDMDLIELSAYGNVRPAQKDSYCKVPGNPRKL